MSTYPETIITEALFAHLATMPGLATLLQSSTTAPIEYPNGGTFIPPKAADGSAKPYLRVKKISSPPDGIDIPGDYARRGGSFAILLFWPLGTGVIAASEVAGAIAAHFAHNTYIERGNQRIRISEPPDEKSENIESDVGIMSIPIVIRYDVLP